jgi:hypothetical protein
MPDRVFVTVKGIESSGNSLWLVQPIADIIGPAEEWHFTKQNPLLAGSQRK